MTREEAKRYIAQLTYEEKKRLMQLLKTIEQQRQQPANTGRPRGGFPRSVFLVLSSTKIQLHYEKFNKVTKRYQTQNSNKLVFSRLFYTM